MSRGGFEVSALSVLICFDRWFFLRLNIQYSVGFA